MLIRNDNELKKLIVPKLEKAAYYVAEKIWNENRELIRVMVYEAYQPSDYTRSGEFKEAWGTLSNSNVSIGKAQSVFEYEPDSMSVGWPSTEYGNNQYGKHASAIDNFDARPYLADIIYQGLAGPAFGHGVESGAWHNKRNVWKELNKRIGKAKIARYFEEGMRQQGLSFKKHRVGIGVKKQ